MSQKRSKIVSREPLSREVERLGLMRFLRANIIDGKNQVSTKFKSNVYEAVVAAIYLDAGLGAAQKFIANTLIANLKRGAGEDYKSKLQEITQENGKKPEYRDQTITEVPPHFKSEVFLDGKKIGEGIGSSKKTAQQNAAQNALENRKNIV